MKRLIISTISSNSGIICYHSSNTKISKLDFNLSNSELGFHCGTLDAALSFNRPLLYEITLSPEIKKSVEVYDEGDWTKLAVPTKLMRDGYITKEEFLNLRQVFNSDSFQQTLREFLVNKGIHALQYKNTSEGITYDTDGTSHYSTSYILLDGTYVRNIQEVDKFNMI